MTKNQVRIKTSFGELLIAFDAAEDLKRSLENAPEWIKAVNENSERLQIVQKSVGGFEDLCALSTSGVPRLLKHPSKKGDAVRLALFLAPKPLTLQQITEACGVPNPLAYVDKKELIKSADGAYSLEAATRGCVVEKIIPQLRNSDARV